MCTFIGEVQYRACFAFEDSSTCQLIAAQIITNIPRGQNDVGYYAAPSKRQERLWAMRALRSIEQRTFMLASPPEQQTACIMYATSTLLRATKRLPLYAVFGFGKTYSRGRRYWGATASCQVRPCTHTARNTIESRQPNNSPGLTNDTSNSKWRTPNPRPRSSPRARGRYRTTRRRPASTTLLRTSPSPRRYVIRCDGMDGSEEEDNGRNALADTLRLRVETANDLHAARCTMDFR